MVIELLLDIDDDGAETAIVVFEADVILLQEHPGERIERLTQRVVRVGWLVGIQRDRDWRIERSALIGGMQNADILDLAAVTFAVIGDLDQANTAVCEEPA